MDEYLGYAKNGLAPWRLAKLKKITEKEIEENTPGYNEAYLESVMRLRKKIYRSKSLTQTHIEALRALNEEFDDMARESSEQNTTEELLQMLGVEDLGQARTTISLLKATSHFTVSQITHTIEKRGQFLADLADLIDRYKAHPASAPPTDTP